MNTAVVHSRTGNQDWVRKTFLYQYSAYMRSRILLHKRERDRQEGSDIGWDRAVVEWTINDCMLRKHPGQES